LLVVIPSLVAAFGTRHVGPLFELASLVPESVWRGQVWRVATHLLMAPSAWTLVFSGLGVYWFGADLARVWGSPSLLRMVGGVAAVSGALVCVIAKLDADVMAKSYLGTAPLVGALVVAWGLSFPDRVVRLWFVISVPGKWLGWGTLAFTALYAAYSGWEHALPELFTELGAVAWVFQASLLRRWSAARAKKAWADSKGAKPSRPTRPARRSSANLRLVRDRDHRDERDEP
jgi:membrane associated rhomboid family serine protease